MNEDELKFLEENYKQPDHVVTQLVGEIRRMQQEKFINKPVTAWQAAIIAYVVCFIFLLLVEVVKYAMFLIGI